MNILLKREAISAKVGVASLFFVEKWGREEGKEERGEIERRFCLIVNAA